VVRVDPRYFRPTEVDTLLGDPTKAQQKLGWVPEITAHQMCQEMVVSDLQEGTFDIAHLDPWLRGFVSSR